MTRNFHDNISKFDAMNENEYCTRFHHNEITSVMVQVVACYLTFGGLLAHYLPLKLLGNFFQKVISFHNAFHYKWVFFFFYQNGRTVQYNEYLISIVDTDSLVL